ncbi:hypothetical protein D3C85_1241690 [compost metagenome]
MRGQVSTDDGFGGRSRQTGQFVGDNNDAGQFVKAQSDVFERQRGNRLGPQLADPIYGRTLSLARDADVKRNASQTRHTTYERGRTEQLDKIASHLLVGNQWRCPGGVGSGTGGDSSFQNLFNFRGIRPLLGDFGSLHQVAFGAALGDHVAGKGGAFGDWVGRFYGDRRTLAHTGNVSHRLRVSDGRFFHGFETLDVGLSGGDFVRQGVELFRLRCVQAAAFFTGFFHQLGLASRFLFQSSLERFDLFCEFHVLALLGLRSNG